MLSACPLALTLEELGIYIYLRSLDSQPHTLPSVGMQNALSKYGHQHTLVKTGGSTSEEVRIRGRTPDILIELFL